MRRRIEFEKDMRQKPSSPLPRFSRTFDLLLSRFPDSADLPANSSSIMASEERTGYKLGQWRTPVSAPLCAFCNKTVYPAEEVMGAGQKYHKLCLKCTSCNTLLTSGSLNVHEKKIYCVSCYRRHFAPRGVGHGLATSYLETPPNSPYSNQEDTDDSSFDQKTSITSSDDGPRQSTSVNRQTSASVTNGTAFKMMSISGTICSRCSKTVYSAEEIKAAGKSFHKQCYKCANCKGSISGGRYSERNGELYDNNCYQRLFGPRGVGFGVGSGALSTGN